VIDLLLPFRHPLYPIVGLRAAMRSAMIPMCDMIKEARHIEGKQACRHVRASGRGAKMQKSG
jgi:hypothetical protein